MKITFINRMAGVARGGGETFDVSAARALADQGWEVTLVTGRRLGRRGEPAGGLPVKYVATPYLRWLMYWGEGRRSYVARRLAGLGKRVDLLLFECAAFLAIVFSPLRHSDVFQLCSLPCLASWLHRHLHKVTVVRWPGPPNHQAGKWRGQYSADVANGAALAEARRHLPHTLGSHRHGRAAVPWREQREG